MIELQIEAFNPVDSRQGVTLHTHKQDMTIML